jgi:hypothetical protein
VGGVLQHNAAYSIGVLLAWSAQQPPAQFKQTTLKHTRTLRQNLHTLGPAALENLIGGICYHCSEVLHRLGIVAASQAHAEAYAVNIMGQLEQSGVWHHMTWTLPQCAVGPRSVGHCFKQHVAHSNMLLMCVSQNWRSLCSAVLNMTDAAAAATLTA